jgi:hypothetical protein
MSYSKTELIKLLQVIYDNTHQGIEWDVNKRNKVMWGGGTRIRLKSGAAEFEGHIADEEGPTLVILEDGVLAIRRFIAETMKDDEFKRYVSLKAVEKQLDTLIRKTAGILPKGSVEETLKSGVLKPLREAIRPWLVFLPIENLLVRKKFKIGDVVFLSSDVARKEIDTLFDEHKFAGDTDEKEGQRKQVETLLSPYHSGYGSYAKVCVRAHASKSSQKATEIAYLCINALRAFTHVLYSHTFKTYFGLPNEVQRGTWLTVSHGNDEKKGFHIDLHQRQANVAFEINKTNMNTLKEHCCFGKIQRIFATPSNRRKEIEVILIQALQALGTSVVAPTIDLKFLNCTTALERMLISDGEETTVDRFTDRLALTLHDDPKQRLKIKQKAKELYNKRSRILHAGFFGVEEEDYHLFENWAIALIVSLLKDSSQYESHKDFCKRTDELKYGLTNSSN